MPSSLSGLIARAMRVTLLSIWRLPLSMPLSESIHVPWPSAQRRKEERGRTVTGQYESLYGPNLALARRAHDATSSSHRRLAMLVTREAVGRDAAVVAGAVDRHVGDGGGDARSGGAPLPQFLGL